MRISLNLATRPYTDLGPVLKRLRIAMAVLLVAALGLGLGLRAFHQKAEEARAAEQSVQNQIDAINQERRGYQELMRQPENLQLLSQVAALNQLFDEKAFSWTLAMEDLETVLPSGVQVTSIEPARAKEGPITLKLRVVGPRDRAVQLVQNLEHSKHFLLPRIVGESSESTGGPAERLEPVSASNRVNFELLADYNPAAPMTRGTERRLADQKEQPNEKPAAAGARLGQPASLQPRAAHPLPVSPAPVSATSAQSPIQPSNLGSGQHHFHSGYNHSPGFNQSPGFNPVSKPRPMPHSSQGGLQ
jgi:type IV pilus assembly protein PilN